MEDSKIVELYFDRNEKAIDETAKKYGKYCYSIANSILSDSGDAEEIVNDTYLEAWNAIPPHRPSVLSTFLGKLTRRISIDRYRRRTAEKRGGGEIPLILDELDECIPSGFTVEREIEDCLIRDTVNSFLSGLCEEERRVFVLRYFYGKSYDEISRATGLSVSRTATVLYRTRVKLKEKLEKEFLA